MCFIIKFSDLIREHCVKLTIIGFLIMAFIAMKYPTAPVITSAITFFGFIFVALKYKLDQASYNKDLFDRRYKIFNSLDKVLSEWSIEGKSSRKLINKVSGSLMRRSYFLFGDETYKFIAEFRHSIIYTEQNEYETDDESFKIEIRKAKNFLVSLVDRQQLSDKFPELKMKIY